MVCTVRCQILYSEISILFLEWNQGNKEKKTKLFVNSEKSFEKKNSTFFTEPNTKFFS